ncbi:MAG: LysR family transcriptional regulator [Epsilonproteobacteria bacterium]|nr:MAG: LysR family transcriptional regulator [Campylobacterota bacterium]RLA65804.1 MAG: LysR family transcriptional regulator [Campylobacterota bacterium]
MKLIQLKLFRDIAYEKSFVKAAQINFMTQPSVSVHLKQLEEELGVRLFDRVPRRVILTPEGKVYLQHVEEILNKCDNLLALPGTLGTSLKGEVRIASIHSIGMYELGPFLRSFMQQYPGIRIHLEYQAAYKVYDLVQKRKAHLGMVAYPEKHIKIQSITYGKDQLGLIVPANHHLAQKDRIRLQQIEGEPFVAFETSTPTREQIDKFLKKKNIQTKIKMTNNNIYALKKAVEAGIGISLVPLSTVDDEVQRGTIRKVKIVGMNLYRPLALLISKKYPVNQVTEVFMDALLAYNN